MSDNIIASQLNALGYQPVVLPRTSLVPPEVYSFSFALGGITRFGPLAELVEGGLDASQQPRQAEVSDINFVYTKTKGLNFGLSLLADLLKFIGISAAPSLSVVFKDDANLNLSYTGVTSLSVDPITISKVLPNARFDLIINPPDIAKGKVHIAFEYLFAREIRISRVDGGEMGAAADGSLGELAKLQASVNIKTNEKRDVSFSAADGAPPAAFALKAGRVEKAGNRLFFRPEQVLTRKIDGQEEEVSNQFIIQPGVILPVFESPRALKQRHDPAAADR